MDKKIKVLFICDDIRLNTGVGIQARKLLTGLVKTDKYEVINAGCALNHQNLNSLMYEGVLIYPVKSSKAQGDKNVIRFLISREKPDIVVPFGDPRFFYYLFEMDDEIREHSKIVYYHTWDNDPFPKFNVPFYKACDSLVMISEFSYNLIKENIDIPCYLIQHGYDSKEFYPLDVEEIKLEREHLRKLTTLKKLDFVIFWNNRNVSRKRPGDVLMIFKEFYKTHPNSLLLMNTDPIDIEGIDMLKFHKDLIEEQIPIIFNFSRIDSQRLNLFYNVADVTINIAYNEGFGLCVGESLLAETPVIATMTGGMTEQMSCSKHYEEILPDIEGKGREGGVEEIVFGVLLGPTVRSLFGVIGAPYIYQDYVSCAQVLQALNYLYDQKDYSKEIGKKGREFIIQNFSIDKVIKKWDEVLTEISSKSSLFKRVKILVV